MDDPDALLTRLVEHEVEFVVIGGFAAVAYGVTLITRDIDVCCPFSVENLMRLQQALDDLRPVHRMTPDKLPIKLSPESCRSLKNLYIGTDLGQLDCLSFVDGVGDYDAVREESIEIDVGGGTCRILSIDALIRAKKAVGGRRDLEAVIQLEAI